MISSYTPSPYIILENDSRIDRRTNYLGFTLFPAYTISVFAQQWFETFIKDWLNHNQLNDTGVASGLKITWPDESSNAIEVLNGKIVQETQLVSFEDPSGVCKNFNENIDGWYLVSADTADIHLTYLNRETVWSNGDLFKPWAGSSLNITENSVLLGYFVIQDNRVNYCKNIFFDAANNSVHESSSTIGLSFHELNTGFFNYINTLGVPKKINDIVVEPSSFIIQADSKIGVSAKEGKVTLNGKNENQIFSVNGVVNFSRSSDYFSGINFDQKSSQLFQSEVYSLFFNSNTLDYSGFLFGLKGKKLSLFQDFESNSFQFRDFDQSLNSSPFLFFNKGLQTKFSIFSESNNARFHVFSDELLFTTDNSTGSTFIVNHGSSKIQFLQFHDGSNLNENGFSFGFSGTSGNIINDFPENHLGISLHQTEGLVANASRGKTLLSVNYSNGFISIGPQKTTKPFSMMSMGETLLIGPTGSQNSIRLFSSSTGNVSQVGFEDYFLIENDNDQELLNIQDLDSDQFLSVDRLKKIELLKGRTTSIHFTGSADDSNVEIPPFSFGGSFTFESWLWIDQFTPDGAFLSFGDTLTDDHIFIGQDGLSGNVKVQLYSSTTTHTPVISTQQSPLNQWFHLAVTYDDTASVISIYFDGNLATSTTITLPSITNTTRAFHFLGKDLSSTNYLEGKIKEFRLWDDIKSQQDIRESLHYMLKGDEEGLLICYNFEDFNAEFEPNKATSSTLPVLDGLINNCSWHLDNRSSAFKINLSGRDSLYFRGNDYLDAVEFDDFDLKTGSICFSFWIRFRKLGSLAPIVDFGNGVDNQNIRLYIQDTTQNLVFEVFEGAAFLYSSSYIPPEDEWLHLSVSYSGANGQVEVYENDSLQDRGFIAGLGEISDSIRNTNFIGRNQNAIPTYGIFELASFQVFNRALRSHEVQELFYFGVSNYRYELINYKFRSQNSDELENSSSQKYWGRINNPHWSIATKFPVVVRSAEAESATISGLIPDGGIEFQTKKTRYKENNNNLIKFSSSNTSRNDFFFGVNFLERMNGLPGVTNGSLGLFSPDFDNSVFFVQDLLTSNLGFNTLVPQQSLQINLPTFDIFHKSFDSNKIGLELRNTASSFDAALKLKSSDLIEEHFISLSLTDRDYYKDVRTPDSFSILSQFQRIQVPVIEFSRDKRIKISQTTQKSKDNRFQHDFQFFAARTLITNAFGRDDQSGIILENSRDTEQLQSRIFFKQGDFYTSGHPHPEKYGFAISLGKELSSQLDSSKNLEILSYLEDSIGRADLQISQSKKQFSILEKIDRDSVRFNVRTSSGEKDYDYLNVTSDENFQDGIKINSTSKQKFLSFVNSETDFAFEWISQNSLPSSNLNLTDSKSGFARHHFSFRKNETAVGFGVEQPKTQTHIAKKEIHLISRNRSHGISIIPQPGAFLIDGAGGILELEANDDDVIFFQSLDKKNPKLGSLNFGNENFYVGRKNSNGSSSIISTSRNYTKTGFGILEPLYASHFSYITPKYTISNATGVGVELSSSHSSIGNTQLSSRLFFVEEHTKMEGFSLSLNNSNAHSYINTSTIGFALVSHHNDSIGEINILFSRSSFGDFQIGFNIDTPQVSLHLNTSTGAIFSKSDRTDSYISLSAGNHSNGGITGSIEFQERDHKFNLIYDSDGSSPFSENNSQLLSFSRDLNFASPSLLAISKSTGHVGIRNTDPIELLNVSDTFGVTSVKLERPDFRDIQVLLSSDIENALIYQKNIDFPLRIGLDEMDRGLFFDSDLIEVKGTLFYTNLAQIENSTAGSILLKSNLNLPNSKIRIQPLDQSLVNFEDFGFGNYDVVIGQRNTNGHQLILSELYNQNNVYVAGQVNYLKAFDHYGDIFYQEDTLGTTYFGLHYHSTDDPSYLREAHQLVGQGLNFYNNYYYDFVYLRGLNNEHIEFTDDLQFPAGSFTVECWAFIEEYSSWGRIFDFDSFGSDRVFLTQHDAANSFKITFQFGVGATPYQYSIDNQFPLKTWFHVAVTYDSNTNFVRIYLDGAAVGEFNYNRLSFPGIGTSPRTSNKIGGENFTNNSINGAFKEFRIWDHARTQTQVKEHLGNRLVENELGLIVLYKFDEGAGLVLNNTISAGFQANILTVDGSSRWRREHSIFNINQLSGSVNTDLDLEVNNLNVLTGVFEPNSALFAEKINVSDSGVFGPYGLNYQYYEKDAFTYTLDNNFLLRDSGIIKNFNYTPQRETKYVIVYTGQIFFRDPGLYVLRLTSTEHATLFISNTSEPVDPFVFPTPIPSITHTTPGGETASTVNYSAAQRGYYGFTLVYAHDSHDKVNLELTYLLPNLVTRMHPEQLIHRSVHPSIFTHETITREHFLVADKLVIQEKVVENGEEKIIGRLNFSPQGLINNFTDTEMEDETYKYDFDFGYHNYSFSGTTLFKKRVPLQMIEDRYSFQDYQDLKKQGHLVTNDFHVRSSERLEIAAPRYSGFYLIDDTAFDRRIVQFQGGDNSLVDGSQENRPSLNFIYENRFQDEAPLYGLSWKIMDNSTAGEHYIYFYNTGDSEIFEEVWMEEELEVSTTLSEAGTQFNTYNNSTFGTITLAPQTVTFSDHRLKTNIRTLDVDKNSPLKLGGYSYERHKNGKIGLLAQEIQRQFPSLVQTDQKNDLSVNYESVHSILIGSLQKIEQRIKTLESE